MRIYLILENVDVRFLFVKEKMDGVMIMKYSVNCRKSYVFWTLAVVKAKKGST